MPWSADYTCNGNEQTVILSNLPGNMFECMDSFIRCEGEPDPGGAGKRQVMYGYPGILAPPHQQPRPEQPPSSVEWPMTFLDHRRRMERPFLFMITIFIPWTGVLFKPCASVYEGVHRVSEKFPYRG